MLDKGIIREHISRGEGGLRYPIARWVNLTANAPFMGEAAEVNVRSTDWNDRSR